MSHKNSGKDRGPELDNSHTHIEQLKAHCTLYETLLEALIASHPDRDEFMTLLDRVERENKVNMGSLTGQTVAHAAARIREQCRVRIAKLGG